MSGVIVYERWMSGYREVARFKDGRRFFPPPPQRMVGDQSQIDLTKCDECGTPTPVMWVLGKRWLCRACYQTAKNLPTLRQLVQARSQT